MFEEKLYSEFHDEGFKWANKEEKKDFYYTHKGAYRYFDFSKSAGSYFKILHERNWAQVVDIYSERGMFLADILPNEDRVLLWNANKFPCIEDPDNYFIETLRLVEEKTKQIIEEFNSLRKELYAIGESKDCVEFIIKEFEELVNKKIERRKKDNNLTTREISIVRIALDDLCYIAEKYGFNVRRDFKRGFAIESVKRFKLDKEGD
jgi:hypothetical protein